MPLAEVRQAVTSSIVEQEWPEPDTLDIDIDTSAFRPSLLSWWEGEALERLEYRNHYAVYVHYRCDADVDDCPKCGDCTCVQQVVRPVGEERGLVVHDCYGDLS